MSTISVEDVHLKDLLKQAILELIQERRDVLEEIFVDVIEDLALARAIEEGEASEPATQAEVLQVLEGPAPNKRLGNGGRSKRAHHPRIYPDVFERSPKGQAVDHGGQHAHLVTRDPINALALAGQATKDIATAHN